MTSKNWKKTSRYYAWLVLRSNKGSLLAAGLHLLLRLQQRGWNDVGTHGEGKTKFEMPFEKWETATL